jgi:tryptophan halogenase
MKINILGAGTAGLVTALILKTKFSNYKINIIKSDDIGIVGVGEGSTEHWAEFMNYVGIKFEDLIKETGATLKSGIMFEGWTKEPFLHSVNSEFSKENGDYYYLYANLISKNINAKQMSHQNLYYNKFIKQDYKDLVLQFHFDTFKLNTFLSKLCKNKNIFIIEDKIKNVVKNDLGNIKQLVGQKQNYMADLFIDCSGFTGFLLKKELEVPYVSYKKYLPLDRAFAFPTAKEKEFNAWTLSRALNYGWNWKIPTQERYGNGYVYSSNHTTEEQAIKEIESVYHQKIKPTRSFKFEAGRVKTFWYKNVVAIGLSAGFVEPLEATSIGSIIQQAFCLNQFLPSLDKKSFNKHNEYLFTNLIEFVQLHYLTKKQNNSFWKDMQELPILDGVQEKLEIAKIRMIRNSDFKISWHMFKAPNWIIMLHALDKFNILNIKKELDAAAPLKAFALQQHKDLFNLSKEYITHNKVIESIR